MGFYLSRLTTGVGFCYTLNCKNMKSIYTLFVGHRWLYLLWLTALALPLRAQVPVVPVIQGQAIIEGAITAQSQARLAKASTGEFGILNGTALTYLTAAGNFRSAGGIDGPVQISTSPVEYNRPTGTAGLAPTSDGGFVVLANDATNLYVIKKAANHDRVWSTILKTSTPTDLYTGVNILPTNDGNFLIFAIHSISGNAGNTNLTKVNSAGNILWSRDLFAPEPFDPFGNSSSIGYTRAVASPDGTFLLTGGKFRPLARPQINAGTAAKINGEGNFIWSRTYSEVVAFSDQAANPSEIGTFFALGITDPNLNGTLTGPTYPYKMQLDGSLVRLGRFTLNSQSRITGGGPGLPYFTVVEGYGTGGSDFIVSGANAQSEVYLSKVLGGSGTDTPQAILSTTDGFLIGGTTTSTDGDIVGKTTNTLATWAVKLVLPTPPNPFEVNVQAYDCNTGQLALAIAGGNGSPVDYRIVGNRDWATSNLFTIPTYQRQGTTFTLEARQNGQVVSRGFTAACGPNTTPQPPTPPQPPTNPSGFYLRAPGYDCTTGKLTALYSNGTGTVEYRIAGLRDWGTSEEFTVPPWQRIGTTFTIEGRLTNGAMSTILFTTACNAGESPLPTPGVPQFPPTLYFIGAPVNCSTGQLTVNVGGSNGTPLSYRIPGLADWQSSPVFTVPAYQRNGTTFTIDIRQTNQQIQASATVNCGAARTGSIFEPGSQLQVTVLPNPVVGNELVTEVTGAGGQAVDFLITDAGGRVRLNQRAVMSTNRQRQTMEVGHLSGGIYLLRVSSDSETKVVKVVKQ